MIIAVPAEPQYCLNRSNLVALLAVVVLQIVAVIEEGVHISRGYIAMVLVVLKVANPVIKSKRIATAPIVRTAQILDHIVDIVRYLLRHANDRTFFFVNICAPCALCG